MRKLVWITGFPRTGTSWLFRQLRRCVECDSIPEEQGLNYLWRTRSLSDYDAMMVDAAKCERQTYDVFLVGCQVAKHMVTRPVWTLDGLTRTTGDKCWLFKSPGMVHDASWPDQYVEHSGRWEKCVTICCKRSAETVWRSGCAKWPFWEQHFGRDAFDKMHAAYYEQAERRGWLVVDHADMAADGQTAVNMLCDELDWCRIKAEPFIVRTV